MKFSDLTEEQVQEICAAFAIREFNCEGVSMGLCWRVVRDNKGDPEQEALCDCPDYHSDLNAMHRIIEGMDDKTSYAVELIRVIENDLLATRGFTIREPLPGWHPREVELLLCAAAQQQFVAAALVLGVLKEELV
jgi:hypothetical protein